MLKKKRKKEKLNLNMKNIGNNASISSNYRVKVVNFCLEMIVSVFLNFQK